MIHAEPYPAVTIDTNRHTVKIPAFSGPMDLLLQLIERNELDISSVSLAMVTDQYLTYMRQNNERLLDNLTDFTVVAARLILIKSQSLLPRPTELVADEPDPGEDLARQLLVYKAFKQTAQILDQRQVDALRTYVRLVVPPKPIPELRLDGKTATDLWRAAVRAFELKGEIEEKVSVMLKRPRITVSEKVSAIVDALRSGRMVRFFEFLKQGQGRTEVVMTFLAILELVKMGRVRARQPGRFGDIEITKQGSWIERDSKDIATELD